jgi:hypothetical protein
MKSFLCQEFSLNTDKQSLRTCSILARDRWKPLALTSSMRFSGLDGNYAILDFKTIEGNLAIHEKVSATISVQSRYLVLRN